jgi:hypothetical protein
MSHFGFIDHHLKPDAWTQQHSPPAQLSWRHASEVREPDDSGSRRGVPMVQEQFPTQSRCTRTFFVLPNLCFDESSQKLCYFAVAHR